MADTPARTTGDPMTREELRERYHIERDKRLRRDRAEQYIDPVGRFAHFLDDPWVPRVEREPLHDEVTVALIGGRFAGLVTGACLVDAGVTDVRIIDSAGEVGSAHGSWPWAPARSTDPSCPASRESRRSAATASIQPVGLGPHRR